jgi:GrpB-like predicted nucleotidyltransferase (UPF0157 family)
VGWDYRGQPPLNDPVVVVDHDPRWAPMFRRERERIVGALGQLAVAVEHVGSTAVPGLAAKPVLDIMVGVERLPLPETALAALAALGYQYRGDGGVPGRQYFRTDPRTRHLHVVALDGAQWTRTLAFRDYLRRHPEAAREYAALKRDLERSHGGERARYSAGKSAFIERILEAAAVDRSRPWFHGSPRELTELRPGSTITQDRALAEAFSHQPSLVSDDRDEPGGALRHNGREPGWLYAVDEPLGPGDLAPVPGSTIGPGLEWLTTRPLPLRRLGRTAVGIAELLSPDEEAALRRRAAAG